MPTQEELDRGKTLCHGRGLSWDPDDDYMPSVVFMKKFVD